MTQIIDGRPAEFLRAHDDIFVMLGGGNVGLKEVLGDNVQSVPAAERKTRQRDPERVSAKRELDALLDHVDLTEEMSKKKVTNKI